MSFRFEPDISLLMRNQLGMLKAQDLLYANHLTRGRLFNRIHMNAPHDPTARLSFNPLVAVLLQPMCTQRLCLPDLTVDLPMLLGVSESIISGPTRTQSWPITNTRKPFRTIPMGMAARLSAARFHGERRPR